ncbi:uncharacterized protein PGTG_12443 [Puccinia graminis f. sp. tritici CRL 75-36-700-3]|uniref:Uncharacterized protein n=1 Tax=Puccinia graminis f. sp. tritici (strain CRL 75-36-700-3 / race SCCL) TaxID=418459 RepID=E3KQB2_PUCGT|nr:uncharacterized protein PGTG_12443 [Puccinia graminis f. sp. tritici CRL 75-36-700-3]EFP86487.2 hypothetical protein PGTG_12443 [Puccinia graminis f. sp. tritici CRL 75-36-700-3]
MYNTVRLCPSLRPEAKGSLHLNTSLLGAHIAVIVDQAQLRHRSLDSNSSLNSMVTFNNAIVGAERTKENGVSRGRRITFTSEIEASRGVTQMNLHEADINLRVLGWSEGTTLWIRARMGSKRNVFWTIASDNELLRFLVGSWAHDCQEFFFALRPKGLPPPQTIRV